MIDCYTPFKDQARLYADGPHPNAAGADTMAHIIYRAITAPVVALARPVAVRTGRTPFLQYDLRGVRLPAGKAHAR